MTMLFVLWSTINYNEIRGLIYLYIFRYIIIKYIFLICKSQREQFIDDSHDSSLTILI